MSETMTAPEVAKRLGVGATTLKTWAEKVGVGEKNGAGVWLFSERDMQTLEIVQALRDEGRTFITITRRLRPNEPSTDTSPPDADQSPPDGDREAPGAEESYPAELVTPTEIERVTELARDFARAAHQIGRLEAEKEHLQAENARLVNELGEARKLLAGGSSEVDDLRRRVAEEAQARAALLEEQRKPRTWWGKLWGGS